MLDDSAGRAMAEDDNDDVDGGDVKSRRLCIPTRSCPSSSGLLDGIVAARFNLPLDDERKAVDEADAIDDDDDDDDPTRRE